MTIAGCGGGSGSTAATTTVTRLPEVVKLGDADVASKSFFSVLPNATSNTAYVTYTFSNTPTSPAANPGEWNISSTGSIVYIDSNSVQHTFTCLQKETNSSYWLMSEASNNNRVSRFYFDVTSAQNYLNSIIAANVTPNGAILGGSVQGTTLPTFNNVSTAAGSITGTSGLDSGTGASGTDARFNHPLGITTDGTYLYVADTYGNTIRKITIGTWTVTRLAGSALGLAGNIDSGTNDTNGDNATFNLPTGITLDGTSLYVADYGNNTIRKVDKNTGLVSTVAGSTTSEAGAVDAVIGTDARFSHPFGITTDGANLYVADCGNYLIRKIVLSSNAVFTLAGAAGSAGSTDSTDGTGSTARFNLPTQLTTDGSNLYVTDFNNSTIRQIVMATGEVTTLAGSAGNIGSVDGTKSAARFNRPNGITTDGVNLYVTDSSYASNNIRKIVIASGDVSTISGVAGNDGSGYVNSADGTAKFNGPAGITTDGISLFVADSLNNSIRLIRRMQ